MSNEPKKTDTQHPQDQAEPVLHSAGILTDIAGERDKINRRILGHWIKRNAGRMVGGLRFAPAGGQPFCRRMARGVGFIGFVGFFKPERKSVVGKKERRIPKSRKAIRRRYRNSDHA